MAKQLLSDINEDFYIYTHPEMNLLPILIDTITMPAGSTDEEILEYWREQQHQLFANTSHYYIGHTSI